MMKLNNIILPLIASTLLLGASSCSHRHRADSLNGYTTVNPVVESYNPLTMDIDPNPVTYTINVSTEDGRVKLNKLTLAEAKELALVETLMTYQCATLFNPQYTHLMKGGKVLRVTVYGYPARYKKKE